jgi:glutaminyl-tRNA synthetase
LSDSIEGVTHSLCTLEFVDHRPLYDWILEQVEAECHPQQIEFARLNLTHTVMSKRLLMRLVSEGHVSGWDDPRMPTVSGMRRRGYSARAIRKFCRSVGVAKRENLIELARLEHAVREDLNETAPRVMGVLRPLKVVIENYPEDQVEEFEAANNPGDESMGTRRVPFSRELYIDRNDFMEAPPRKFFRMSPGREVRLRSAYLVTCVGVVNDEASGEPVELRCTYDPASRGGNAPDGRKVKGTLHWVSAPHALPAEVRLYEPLFSDENPSLSEDRDLASLLNPESLTVLVSCQVEPGLADGPVGSVYQFEREGYFAVDGDSTEDALVFNRTVTLRDTWAKVDAKISK